MRSEPPTYAVACGAVVGLAFVAGVAAPTIAAVTPSTAMLFLSFNIAILLKFGPPGKDQPVVLLLPSWRIF